MEKNRTAKKRAYEAYKEECVTARREEYNAIGEMLSILRATDKPMTAAQIETACTSGLSKHEIVGNLEAMKWRNSRYRRTYYFDKEMPIVEIPIKKNLKIKTRYGEKVLMAEITPDGKIIPNTARYVAPPTCATYNIEE